MNIKFNAVLSKKIDYDYFASRPGLIFLIFITINTLKSVLVYNYCDFNRVDFYLIQVTINLFCISLLFYGLAILTNRKLIMLLLYALQAIYLFINITYTDAFNSYFEISYCYQLWREIFTISNKLSDKFETYSLLLTIIDLPIVLIFYKDFSVFTKNFRLPLKINWLACCSVVFLLNVILPIKTFLAIPPQSITDLQSGNYYNDIFHHFGFYAHDMVGLSTYANKTNKNLLELQINNKVSSQDTDAPHPNIILLQVESLDANIIDFTWHGKYVAPFIHALSRQCVYFPYMMSYHKAGGSSDCEVSVLNSVEPLSYFPTIKSKTYEYPNSMVKELNRNKYQSLAFHGNSGEFYNRNVAYYQMGFDVFYDRLRMGLQEEGWGASDHKVFDYALAKLSPMQKPFFSYIITMSSHEPFKNIENYYSTENFEDIDLTLSRRYLKSIEYVDTELKKFVTEIQNSKPDTWILIYGDHTPYVVNKGPFRRAHFVFDNKEFEFVPLLIVTPDKNVRLETRKAASMLDIAPTVLKATGGAYRYATDGENLMTPLQSKILYRGASYSRESLYRMALDTMAIK